MTTAKKTPSARAIKKVSVPPKASKAHTGAVTSAELKKALQEHFGFDAFKGNQEAIIKNLLAGNDTFVIMPTGGGKSLCYQLPAIISEGVAIIVSPLIALMKNQVDLVRGYSSKDDVAHFLNSTLNKKEIKEVQEDLVSAAKPKCYTLPLKHLPSRKILNFSKTSKFLFLRLMKRIVFRNGDMTFGPEYRRLREMMEQINPDSPDDCAYSNRYPKVQSDIVKNLGLAGCLKFLFHPSTGQIFITKFSQRSKKSRHDKKHCQIH